MTKCFSRFRRLAREIVCAYQLCGLMLNDYGWNFTEQSVEPIPSVVEGTFFVSIASFSPLGGSIFVYQDRFEVPLVAASSYTECAEQLIELNRLDEAIADGQKAVEIAPDDPRPHLALAAAFSSVK